MAISEAKKKIVIDNYFKKECDVNTSIKEAFTKGFELGLKKAPIPQQKMGRWIRMKAYEKWGCSECHTVFKFTFKEHDFCPNCGAKMGESEDKE